MEVTKWLKPSISVSRIGDSASVSTMSICSIEDVAAAVDAPFWFQLYVMRDRGFVRELIQRAIAVKCSALFPTLDLPILGQDVKNGMTVQSGRRTEEETHAAHIVNHRRFTCLVHFAP
jgi:isopentenyl diphosphate isomerase/L-lactate dehydrogenase-like FMN-dependent dehydrogenase